MKVGNTSTGAGSGWPLSSPQFTLRILRGQAIEPVARDFSRSRELLEKQIDLLKHRADDFEQLYRRQEKRADDNLCVIVGLREKVAALGGPPFEMTKEVRALKKLCEVRLQEMGKEANPQKQKSVPEKQQPVPYERPKGILFAKN